MAGVDFYRKVENVVRLYAPLIRADLLASVASSGLQRKTGALASGYKERVMKDGIEVWAVKFRGPRYGFMQHSGMEAKTLQGRGGVQYHHPGYPGRKFLTAPIKRGTALLTARISGIARDMIVDEIDSAFE